MMRTSMPCEVPTETPVDLRCGMQVWLVAVIYTIIHTMFIALPPMGNWCGENARCHDELLEWSSGGVVGCHGKCVMAPGVC